MSASYHRAEINVMWLKVSWDYITWLQVTWYVHVMSCDLVTWHSHATSVFFTTLAGNWCCMTIISPLNLAGKSTWSFFMTASKTHSALKCYKAIFACLEFCATFNWLFFRWPSGLYLFFCHVPRTEVHRFLKNTKLVPRLCIKNWNP